jgi:hypothetical protein
MVLGDERKRQATSVDLSIPMPIDTVRSALLEHALQSGLLQRDASRRLAATSKITTLEGWSSP